MCNFWSCIIDGNGRVWWDKNNSSHNDLLQKAGLKDDKLIGRNFVRIEVTPKDIFSKKRSDWVYKVDEKGTLPSWYEEKKEKYEEIVWKEWKKAMESTLWKLNLSAGKKFLAEVKSVKYFSMKGKVKPEWHMSYGKTWTAARAAAWNAAMDAVRDAAGKAGEVAWEAAGKAGEAAGKAAWEAGEAAWEAGEAAGKAGEVAWEAAGKAALKMRFTLCSELKIDIKHKKHVNARWDVWKRGYGLMCDVNGKLFVYAIKKED